MKLFLLRQDSNRDWDTYDSIVVAAPDEETARITTPDSEGWREDNLYGVWCDTPEMVTVDYLGIAEEGVKQGIICSSFNAG